MKLLVLRLSNEPAHTWPTIITRTKIKKTSPPPPLMKKKKDRKKRNMPQKSENKQTSEPAEKKSIS